MLKHQGGFHFFLEVKQSSSLHRGGFHGELTFTWVYLPPSALSVIRHRLLWTTELLPLLNLPQFPSVLELALNLDLGSAICLRANTCGGDGFSDHRDVTHSRLPNDECHPDFLLTGLLWCGSQSKGAINGTSLDATPPSATCHSEVRLPLRPLRQISLHMGKSYCHCCPSPPDIVPSCDRGPLITRIRETFN